MVERVEQELNRRILENAGHIKGLSPDPFNERLRETLDPEFVRERLWVIQAVADHRILGAASGATVEEAVENFLKSVQHLPSYHCRLLVKQLDGKEDVWLDSSNRKHLFDVHDGKVHRVIDKARGWS